MIYGYARVSTKSQNVDRQITSLNEFNKNINCIFIDYKSGRDFNRIEYQKLKKALKSGDELIIHELDRLGRNKKQILDEIKWHTDNNIILRILNIPTTLNVSSEPNTAWIFDMINNILFEVLSSIAQNERTELSKRTKEGLEVAKEKGIKLGRPFIDKRKIEKIKELYGKDIGVSEIASLLKLSKGTVRKYAINDKITK